MYTDNVACKRGLKAGRMCCRILSVSSVEAGDSKHRLCFFPHTAAMTHLASLLLAVSSMNGLHGAGRVCGVLDSKKSATTTSAELAHEHSLVLAL